MKKSTKIRALESAIEKEKTQKASEAATCAVSTAISGLEPEATIAKAVQDAVGARKKAVDSAENWKKTAKKQREWAENGKKMAENLARVACRMGGDYSGDTKYVTEWGKSRWAATVTSAGDAYSRRCKYNKTDATHTVTIVPDEMIDLVDAPLLASISHNDGLPLIAYDADSASCAWIVTRNKRISWQSGYVAFSEEHRLCYHSPESREKAEAGLHRKVSELLREREEAKRLQREHRRANRREYLIAALCNVEATIEDARRLSFCESGIREFQSRYGIGDRAQLRDLMRTGDPSAQRLALCVARKVKKQEVTR